MRLRRQRLTLEAELMGFWNKRKCVDGVYKSHSNWMCVLCIHLCNQAQALHGYFCFYGKQTYLCNTLVNLFHYRQLPHLVTYIHKYVKSIKSIKRVSTLRDLGTVWINIKMLGNVHIKEQLYFKFFGHWDQYQKTLPFDCRDTVLKCNEICTLNFTGIALGTVKVMRRRCILYT